MSDPIQMPLDEVLAWIKLGLENGNYDAARKLLEDVISQLKTARGEDE